MKWYKFTFHHRGGDTVIYRFYPDSWNDDDVDGAMRDWADEEGRGCERISARWDPVERPSIEDLNRMIRREEGRYDQAALNLMFLRAEKRAMTPEKRGYALGFGDCRPDVVEKTWRLAFAAAKTHFPMSVIFDKAGKEMSVETPVKYIRFPVLVYMTSSCYQSNENYAGSTACASISKLEG